MSDEIVKYSNQFNNQALHFPKCSAYRVLAPVMAVQILGVPRRVGGGVGHEKPLDGPQTLLHGHHVCQSLSDLFGRLDGPHGRF